MQPDDLIVEPKRILKATIKNFNGVTLKGEKGDTGEKGEKGDKGATGSKGKDGKDGLNGVDGKDGRDGKDGVDGLNGKDGVDGKDAVLGELEIKDIKELPETIATLQNRTQLLNQMVSGISNRPTTTGGTGTPGGADTQVQFNDGGSFGADAHFYYNKTTDVLHVHGIAGDATDGLLIESESGTDIAIMGAANTANVIWYGNHNFNTVTASRVAQFGASKTLESSSVTNTELSYLSGATSNIQTQINSITGGSLTLTTVEVDLGSRPVDSGNFTITTSGLTAGKAVSISQAVGAYTGKGSLADECEMDFVNVSASTTSTTQIVGYWNSNTLVRGNFKFNYVVSA